MARRTPPLRRASGGGGATPRPTRPVSPRLVAPARARAQAVKSAAQREGELVAAAMLPLRAREVVVL